MAAMSDLLGRSMSSLGLTPRSRKDSTSPGVQRPRRMSSLETAAREAIAPKTRAKEEVEDDYGAQTARIADFAFIDGTQSLTRLGRSLSSAK